MPIEQAPKKEEKQIFDIIPNVDLVGLEELEPEAISSFADEVGKFLQETANEKGFDSRLLEIRRALKITFEYGSFSEFLLNEALAKLYKKKHFSK